MRMRESEILLESGTNELEIMEFTIAKELFGINVAKIREIMQHMPVKAMQNAHPCVEGIFKPRDEVITVVDLAKYLGLPPAEDDDRQIFMITEFNKQVIAFRVHSVVGINRISWQQVQKPDQLIYGGEEGVATGIAEVEDRLITILDFEKIVAEIAPQSSIQTSDIELLGDRNRLEIPILIVEDSMLLSKLLQESLHKAGYVNLIKTDNGEEAWEFLTQAKQNEKPLDTHVQCVVTDIEMPRMDGHRLLKLIKDDPVLQSLPVILFSSLITDEMRLKGDRLGADAQISKPEITSLVRVIDTFMAQK